MMRKVHKNDHDKAIVLLSGGLDSTTCLAIAMQKGYDVSALSFNYHQRHRVELKAASQIARKMGISNHLILDLPLDRIGGSALTDNIPVPKDASLDSVDIPITYVPARNTVFLSLALAWAEVTDAEHIFIGVNALDYSGYPDCRPKFISAFRKMANVAMKKTIEGTMTIRIHTPLMRKTKSEIIKTGIMLGVDYSMTRSCYDPNPAGDACGHCDSCILRRRGFEQAGVDDPTVYQS
jgi:7-cyano-7-deazaguanine synthase